jgi:hypothetical protein
MPPQLSPERAEILGLDALTWLAGQPQALEKFLKLSGISGADLRTAAGSPGLSLAVLEFLLSHEEFLLPFCDSHGTQAEQLHQARHVLAPEA